MAKGKKYLALFLAAGLVITAIPSGTTHATGIIGNDPVTTVNSEAVVDPSTDLSYEGYEEVWGDEFDGTELNRDVWNVETHEKGWVNSELQAYVDNDEVLQVKDGYLNINPVKTVEHSSEAAAIVKNADFSSGKDDWVETIANWGDPYHTVASSTVVDNGIKYTITDPGDEDWHVQLKQDNLNLKAGHKYKVAYNVTSTEARQIKSGVQSASYTWYGGADPVLEANAVTPVEYEFTMEADDDTATVYFSLGKIADVETPASDITITDITFTDLSDDGEGEDVVSYTSGRISTQNKQTFTYGLFECRAKVPAGQGYLPAFWLMANDENVYGQWPRCGEIDCMEVMGQDPDKLYGTIHYGNPHAESQGTYEITDGASFADEFHTFACEWLPGRINWYVDGKLYHTENNWYSTTVGQGTLTYPAPFDQPFYIILNLAVGGSWVGNPDDTTSFDNNPYVIDYVKVYQKDSYDENVQKPENNVELRDPDVTGNYVNNGDFSVEEDLTDDTDWKFLTALGGEAAATISGNEMNIDTTNEGTVDYSVQLVQAGVPLLKGATYRVSFDACAAEARTMHVDVKAPDHGYINYMNGTGAEVALDTEYNHYEYEFKMKSDSDANGRLEYNMGATGSNAQIKLKNVRIEKIADPDPNEKEEKTVLANGNYVYNGGFQEGTGHLGYWDITKSEGSSVSVTDYKDGRRFKAVIPEAASEYVFLSQDDMTFNEGTPYLFSFDLEADTDTTVKAVIAGVECEAEVVKGEKKTYRFEIPSTTEFSDKSVSFTFDAAGTYYLDNVKMVENAMIKNGSFNDGETGYTIYIDSSAKASHVVDSIKEDNALSLTIDKTGDADWKIQVKQEDVKLEAGKTYRLKLKAKSSVDRDIRVVMQGGEKLGWPVYSNDNVISLTSEYTEIEDVFTMNEDTDPAAFLSICLGKVDREITDQHVVCIDDISLEEVKAEKEIPEYEVPENQTIHCGQTLADITLPEGFSFEEPGLELAPGISKVTLKYTPADTDKYEIVTGIEITITVEHDHKDGVCVCGDIADGFAKVNGKWGFYKDQKIVSNYTGVVKGVIDGKSNWYYVKNGVYTKASGITKRVDGKGNWYYVKNGVYTKASGIAKKVDGTGNWYYVKNGVLTRTNGITKKADGSSATWFYVKNGVFTKATGIAKKADGSGATWYYVKNGAYTKATCIAKKADGSSKTQYYVKTGSWANKFTGTIKIGKKNYKIVNGVVR